MKSEQTVTGITALGWATNRAQTESFEVDVQLRPNKGPGNTHMNSLLFSSSTLKVPWESSKGHLDKGLISDYFVELT